MASKTHDSRIRRVPSAARNRLATTLSMAAGVGRRRDTLSVFGLSVVGYLFAFLWMMQNVFVEFDAGFSLSVPVREPLARMFERSTGQYAFEPIAIVELGVITWLFSPLNTLIGLALAVLVGLNLALTYLALRQPKSCGIGATTGILASVPALLAGSACCAPIIVVILGLQISGLVLAAFTWLLPIGAAMLVGSLVYIAAKVDPTAI